MYFNLSFYIFLEEVWCDVIILENYLELVNVVENVLFILWKERFFLWVYLREKNKIKYVYV